MQAVGLRSAVLGLVAAERAVPQELQVCQASAGGKALAAVRVKQSPFESHKEEEKAKARAAAMQSKSCQCWLCF
jgi:hypothetical protein